VDFWLGKAVRRFEETLWSAFDGLFLWFVVVRFPTVAGMTVLLIQVQVVKLSCISRCPEPGHHPAWLLFCSLSSGVRHVFPYVFFVSTELLCKAPSGPLHFLINLRIQLGGARRFACKNVRVRWIRKWLRRRVPCPLSQLLFDLWLEIRWRLWIVAIVLAETETSSTHSDHLASQGKIASKMHSTETKPNHNYNYSFSRISYTHPHTYIS
jgi:hypothetical protein